MTNKVAVEAMRLWLEGYLAAVTLGGPHKDSCWMEFDAYCDENGIDKEGAHKVMVTAKTHVQRVIK